MPKHTKTILVPLVRQWHPSTNCITRLYKLYTEALSNIETTKAIHFDFSECDFLGNHGCVFLGGLDVFLKLKFRLQKITYGNFCNSEVNRYMNRLGYYDKEQGWTHLPYSDFSMEDIRLKKPYKDINILLKQDIFPFQSDTVKETIKDKMGELFLNVLQHSNSPHGATASAQYYPTEKIIRFSLVDFGIGIARNIQQYSKTTLRQNISEGEALLKAFEKRFTTKKGSNGLGLKIIKDFILQNESKISILCNRVYYQYDGASDKEHRYRLKTEQGFDGTFIVIDFNTRKIC